MLVVPVMQLNAPDRFIGRVATPDGPCLLILHEQLPYWLVSYCHLCLPHAVGHFPTVLGNGQL